MEKIVADGVTAEEVEKGKAMLKGRYVLDREDSMAQGYLAAAELLYRGKVSDQKEQFDLIDGVTAADIQAAAARYLRPDEIRGALVGPPGLDVDGVIPIAARAA
jgi:predicted Zn-dependent peptidase